MASTSGARVFFRVAIAVAVIVVLFYVGRPLYWKISATVHDIRHNKQSVREGLSQIVHEARRTVGWYSDESDLGIPVDRTKKSGSGLAATRKLLVYKV